MSIIVNSSGGAGVDTGIFAEYGSGTYPKSLKIILPTIPDRTFSMDGTTAYAGLFTSEATLVEIKTTNIGVYAFRNFFYRLPDKAKLKIDATSIGETSFAMLETVGSDLKVWISSKCSSLHASAFPTDLRTKAIVYCEAESAGSGWGVDWSKWFKSVMYGVTEAEFDAL